MALTSHDAAILATLFDAEGTINTDYAPETATNDEPARQNTHQQPDDQVALANAQSGVLATLNAPDPAPSIVHAAIDALTALIAAHPASASLHANRAQAFRLLVPTPALFTPQHAVTMRRVLADLDTAAALLLAAPRNAAHDQDARRMLADVQAHRGLLLLAAAGVERLGMRAHGLGEELGKLGAAALEERGAAELEAAGRLGSAVARRAAVACNPYAKMCGRIVKDAVERERGGVGTVA